jgi:hypothetical protein
LPAHHELMGGQLHIYIRPDSKYWQCATFLNGHNHRSSTKLESLAQAKDFAEDWFLTLKGKLLKGELRDKKRFAGEVTALIGSKAQQAKLEDKQKDERVYFGRKLKDRADHLTLKIRKDHERDLAELRKRQDAERSELRSRQSEESKEQAREIREGRDEQVYRNEKREQRRQEVIETKRDIEQRRPQDKPRGQSLADKFNRASRKQENDAGRSAQGSKQVQPQETPAPKQAKETQAQRSAAFKEQAKDITGKREKPAEERKGSLAEKFRKAQERNAVQERQEEKKSNFRDNAEDASRDKGRGRSRTIKPPGGPKRN